MVQGHLFVFLPLLPESFDRAWLGEITSTDASSDYECGGVCAKGSPAEVASVGSFAENEKDYVRLMPSTGDPLSQDRIGEPHQVNLRFRT